MNTSNYKISVEEMIITTLNVNRTQARILLFLLKNGKSGVNSIAENLKLERSTVEKNLRTLMNRTLVMRYKENRNRGYRYVYTCLCKNDLKKNLKKRIEKICRDMRSILKNL